MRLIPRVEKLEADAPSEAPFRHVILAAKGEEGKAFDEYGRDKIKDEDDVMLILLVPGTWERQPWRA